MPVSLTASGITYTDGTVESTPFSDTKAIFGFGAAAGAVYTRITNQTSSFGNIATDVTVAGASRQIVSAATYGGNKAIFGFGTPNSGTTRLNTISLFSNTGVYVSESSGSGTSRYGLAAAGYGGDKAIFGFGTVNSPTFIYYNTINLFSNTGAYVSESSGVGTARQSLAAASFSL